MKTWSNAVKATAAGFLIAALGTVVGSFAPTVTDWRIWDVFVEREPIDVPVVISTTLQFDESGVYTGEIRRALDDASFSYRSINRIFPEQRTIVPSTTRPENVRSEARRLLDDHGGDVLIYGAVGAKPNTIFIQIFGRRPSGYVEAGLEIDLGQEAWHKGFVEIVAEAVTESGLEQLLGKRGIRAGMSVEEFLVASENKLSTINQIVESAYLKERTELGIEAAQVTKAKARNDIATIRRIRKATQERFKGVSSVERPAYHEALRLSLADLYMVEGLMEGSEEKIEEGLIIATDAGQAALASAMENDESAVQNPEDATFSHWLLMTILVLACNDQEAVRHMENLIMNNCGREGEKCMAESDALRILLPLALFSGEPDVESLREFQALFSELRDFGMGTVDHWQDPFLHARRSIEKRLELANGSHKVKGEATNSSCPCLTLWMRNKGWYEGPE